MKRWNLKRFVLWAAVLAVLAWMGVVTNLEPGGVWSGGDSPKVGTGG